MANNMIEELMGIRVRMEREGKEIANVPGILALPALLAAPKASLLGLAAAPLLGCSIHLENKDGKDVNLGKVVKETAEPVADAAGTAARTVREEMEKAWDALSAEDPEEQPETSEEDEAPAGQNDPEDDPPVIRVEPDDSDRE